MTIKSTGRFIAVFIAVFLLFTAFTSFTGIDKGGVVYGATTTTPYYAKATVKEGPLNVRSGPGTSYSIRGKLAEGKSVTVLYKVVASGSTWYKYKYSASKYGYINSKYVKLSKIAVETTLYNKEATVKNGPVNIRSGPGTSYSILSKLSNGKKFTIVSKIKRANGEIWYKYKYSSSKYGYVSGKYVTIKTVNKETSLINKKATAANATLNVRSGPGTNYSVIGSLKKGVSVPLISQVKTSSGDVWYKYQYSASKYGYISASYVNVSDDVTYTETMLSHKEATVKEGPLTVRSGPATVFTKIGSLEAGKTVELISKLKTSKDETWYKFKYNDGYGYIISDYVTVNTAIVGEETKVSGKIAIINSDSLNVREGPGTDYSQIGKLTKGEQIEVLTKVKTQSGSIWYKFKMSDGKYGYISSSYATLKDKPEPVTFKLGTVTTDSGVALNVRSGAGTSYSKIGSLNSGSVIVVTGSEKASNGKTWYKYQFSSTKAGYVSADYLSVKTVTSSSEFEAELTAQGFPESYKPALRALHEEHPNWTFKAYNVGCTWNTAVAKENARPSTNVVSPSLPTSYRSKDSDCYSKSSGWNRYDGSWYSAHTDVIRHYMDPRNFLDDTGIFQFVTHKYDASTQSASTVAAVVKGTFMETRNPGGGYSKYSTLINDAGKASGVNPNVLAAMIVQEQGTKGSSGLISGTYSGYKGYYNFFNVGAYTTSTMTAVQRGLWYAKQQGWNSVYKSILGGAKFYANGYVNNNQDTYYTKKFNVKNGVDKIATHQYMTNVSAAYSEGKLLSKAFPSSYNKELVFEIPVYNSMPAQPCPLP